MSVNENVFKTCLPLSSSGGMHLALFVWCSYVVHIIGAQEILAGQAEFDILFKKLTYT